VAVVVSFGVCGLVSFLFVLNALAFFVGALGVEGTKWFIAALTFAEYIYVSILVTFFLFVRALKVLDWFFLYINE